MTKRLNFGTIKFEDMRLFAKVAEARSFTGAARSLGVPKQTLSRRIGELESALGVALLQRTTRSLRLTEIGAAYAEQCADLARFADEANRTVTDRSEEPNGLLRITADPLIGETFLTPLVIEFTKRWPAIRVEVLLTQRRVDIVDEGFDIAIRIGQVDDKRLTATSLGRARIRYCASPRYVRAHGAPKSHEDLASHQCLVVHSDDAGNRWPVLDRKGMILVPVSGRLRVNSFSMAYAAAIAGLGIIVCPELVCGEDLKKKRLVSVLAPDAVDVGSIWLLHPIQRYLAARVRAFADLVISKSSWFQTSLRARRAH